MNNLVIYHANCNDGFGAAWAAWRALGDEDTEYQPQAYGQALELEYDYKRIYIVDFSFDRTMLKNLCAITEKVYILDHHKTAQADLCNWEDRPHNLYIHFDMNKSGAMLAWEYFHPHTEAPELIKYIQDRDLWRKQLPHSEEINAYIQLADKTFDAYCELYADLACEFSNCVHVGESLLKRNQQIVSDIVKLARPMTFHFPSQLTPITGLAANCTGHFASDVGNELAKLSQTFGASYYTESDGSVKWSLRSIGDFDVSWIAKQFGGGGHKNAAGFVLHEAGRDTDKEINLWCSETAGLEKPVAGV